MPVLIEVEAATDISFFWCVTDLDVLALSFRPWNKKFKNVISSLNDITASILLL